MSLFFPLFAEFPIQSENFAKIKFLIMNKFPFTNAGFVDLQQVLYAYPDAELQTEAQLIHSNFIVWVDNHFILSAEQLHFLNCLDNREINLLAYLTSFAVENRRPVVLHAEEPPPDDDKQGKIIKPKSTLSAGNGPNVPFEATGTLEIHISY